MERIALPICHPSTQCLKVQVGAATPPATHEEWFLDKVNTNAQEPQICAAEHVAKAPCRHIVLWMLYPKGAWKSSADHLLFCLTVIVQHIHRTKRNFVLLITEQTMLLSTCMVAVYQKLLLMR